MARLSLIAASMSLCAVGVTGCFDAPPEYSVPERIPPLLDEHEADPTFITEFRPGGTTLKLEVPFQVRPTEERTQAAFILDLDVPPGRQLCSSKPVDGETAFRCEQEWSNFTTAGCHTVTVRASYVSNFGNGFAVNDESLATEATWFVVLEEEANTIECFRGLAQ